MKKFTGADLVVDHDVAVEAAHAALNPALDKYTDDFNAHLTPSRDALKSASAAYGAALAARDAADAAAANKPKKAKFIRAIIGHGRRVACYRVAGEEIWIEFPETAARYLFGGDSAAAMPANRIKTVDEMMCLAHDNCGRIIEQEDPWTREPIASRLLAEEVAEEEAVEAAEETAVSFVETDTVTDTDGTVRLSFRPRGYIKCVLMSPIGGCDRDLSIFIERAKTVKTYDDLVNFVAWSGFEVERKDAFLGLTNEANELRQNAA